MTRQATTFIALTPEQDKQLQTLERNTKTIEKARLRANLLRLSNKGWSIPKLSKHFNRHKTTIKQDFKRWQQSGIAGLTDGVTTGRPKRLTIKMQQWIQEQLEGPTIWNTQLLSKALHEKFGLVITATPLRRYLLQLGYRWKRARFSSSKPPALKIKKAHQASLETLKKGHWQRN